MNTIKKPTINLQQLHGIIEVYPNLRDMIEYMIQKNMDSTLDINERVVYNETLKRYGIIEESYDKCKHCNCATNEECDNKILESSGDSIGEEESIDVSQKSIDSLEDSNETSNCCNNQNCARGIETK